MSEYFFLPYLINGISIASILFLIASGLSLVLGIVGILNFAHGSFYMIGAYLFLWTTIHFPQNPFLTLIIVPILTGCLGGIIELGIMRPIYKKGLMEQLLITFALIFIFEDLTQILWGAKFKTVPVPDLLSAKIRLAGHPVSIYFIFVIGVAVVVALGLWYFINRTYWGKIIKASSSDKEMANAIGVNVSRLFTGVFFLGSVLAGLGGVMAAPMRGLTPAMGAEIILYAVAVIVIGGLGSLGGTIIGSLILGMLDSFGVWFFPRSAMLFLYVAMALVLLARPRGLFGKVVGEV